MNTEGRPYTTLGGKLTEILNVKKKKQKLLQNLVYIKHIRYGSHITTITVTTT